MQAKSWVLWAGSCRSCIQRGPAHERRETERPTPKRLRDSREKGEVAHSRDFTQTALICALFGHFLINAPSILASLRALILAPAAFADQGFAVALGPVLTEILDQAVRVLAPLILIVLGVGMFAEFLQVGVVLAFRKLKPSAEKLNPAGNLKNIFSARNLMEFIKSVCKILFLAVLVTLVIRDSLQPLMAVPHSGLDGLRTGVGRILQVMVWNIGLAYGAISLADLAWQRYQYRKGLRMSKDEVKQEYKEMEGDPHIKQQRKHLHQELIMHGAAAQVRRATVLVTNPTHLAVALYYAAGETPLPRVLAMGQEPWPLMVEAARDAGVPVMQNVALARALHDQAEVDQYIPGELVEPVAAVLRAVRQALKEQT